MSKDKETKKLDAELLEKRMAPFGTVMDQEVPDEPGGTTGGGGGVSVPADEPGNSDGHRDKPFWKNE